MTRDVVFLVADDAMRQMLCGFLERPQCHRSLGCGPFDFDEGEDLLVAPFRDPDVYGRARQLLSPYEARHQYAVAMLDVAWAGNPGPQAIRAAVGASLEPAWAGRFAVIAIEPELEAWIWQDSPHLATAFKCCSDFRDILCRSGHWPAGVAKPPDPKAALDELRRRHHADRSNAAFRRLAGRVGVRHCQDVAFGQLRDALRTWFPVTDR